MPDLSKKTHLHTPDPGYSAPSPPRPKRLQDLDRWGEPGTSTRKKRFKKKKFFNFDTDSFLSSRNKKLSLPKPKPIPIGRPERPFRFKKHQHDDAFKGQRPYQAVEDFRRPPRTTPPPPPPPRDDLVPPPPLLERVNKVKRPFRDEPRFPVQKAKKPFVPPTEKPRFPPEIPFLAPTKRPLSARPRRKKVKPNTTTPRPIPLPGVDFPFMIPPKNPIAAPGQNSGPVKDEYDDYEYAGEYEYKPELYEFDYDHDNDVKRPEEKLDDNDLGFMAVGFSPSFESMRLKRKKREADPEGNLFWRGGGKAPPRRRRGSGRRRSRNPYPRGGGGNDRAYRDEYQFSHAFWEDVDDDVEEDFFPNQQYGLRDHQYNTGYGQENPRDRRPSRYSLNTDRSYNRDPYPQQSIQSYPESNKNDYYDPYVERHNAVLGSGNFEVLKGGTFYDSDVYYYGGDNRQPQSYNSADNILNNFRDFADIKNDLYRYKWFTMIFKQICQ